MQYRRSTSVLPLLLHAGRVLLVGTWPQLIEWRFVEMNVFTSLIVRIIFLFLSLQFHFALLSLPTQLPVVRAL